MATEGTGPGRVCPVAYRYRPEDLTSPADQTARTLFAAGGLYGNPYAAEAIEQRVAAEPDGALLVFNGDVHYLDAEPEAFGAVAGVVGRHRATLGNVEYAIGAGGDAIGCGCDYLDYVADEVVRCSNEVVERLSETARGFGEHVAALRRAPRWLVVSVGGRRVGVVHGDLTSVAGWRLALENVDPADATARSRGWLGTPTDAALLDGWFDASGLDVLCCTHTGLPYGQRAGERVVINSGCAGLPCFARRPHGVITRVSAEPDPPPDSLYGTAMGGLRVDALPVAYDDAAWRSLFGRIWPPGSAGDRGYARRLVDGPAHTVAQAARDGFAIGPAARG